MTLSRSSTDFAQTLESPIQKLVGTAVGYAFVHADKYVRAQRRVDILDVLADAGIVVDQVGVGDGANPALRRHREHGPVPLSRLPRWLRGARLVVHAGLNRPTGSHERVFTAQHQGAVVIAEATPYWRDVLSDGSDAVLFDWTDLEALPARVKALLDEPDELQRIGEAGRRIAEDSIARAGDQVVAAVQAALRLRECTALTEGGSGCRSIVAAGPAQTISQVSTSSASTSAAQRAPDDDVEVLRRDPEARSLHGRASPARAPSPAGRSRVAIRLRRPSV